MRIKYSSNKIVLCLAYGGPHKLKDSKQSQYQNIMINTKTHHYKYKYVVIKPQFYKYKIIYNMYVTYTYTDDFKFSQFC